MKKSSKSTTYQRLDKGINRVLTLPGCDVVMVRRLGEMYLEIPPGNEIRVMYMFDDDSYMKYPNLGFLGSVVENDLLWALFEE